MQPVYITVLLVLALARTGDALSCYICNSTLEANCQEMFDHDMPNHPQQSRDCHMYNAKYCIKVTGLWGGVVGTHRFCSSRDMGDQCQDIGYMDHDRMYRACIYTCTRDGCNASSKIAVSLICTTILAALSSLMMLL